MAVHTFSSLVLHVPEGAMIMPTLDALPACWEAHLRVIMTWQKSVNIFCKLHKGKLGYILKLEGGGESQEWKGVQKTLCQIDSTSKCFHSYLSFWFGKESRRKEVWKKSSWLFFFLLSFEKVGKERKTKVMSRYAFLRLFLRSLLCSHTIKPDYQLFSHCWPCWECPAVNYRC